MPEIKTTLVLEDKLTKGMKDATDAMEKMGDASEEAVTKAMKLGQQMEDIGVSADEMTDDFLELNPQLKLYKKLTDEAAKETKELSVQQEKANKQTEGGAKGSNKLTKGLGGMTKGLIGVATAYAGGRAVVGFAKDSLAAADAAGTLAPEIGDLARAIADLKVMVGTGLGNVLAPIAKGATDVLDSHTSIISETKQINKLRKEGQISEIQRMKLLQSKNKGLEFQTEIEDTLNKNRIQNQKVELHFQQLTDFHDRERLGIAEKINQANADNQALMSLTNDDFEEMAVHMERITAFAELGMARAAERAAPTRAGRAITPGEGFGVDVGLGGGIGGQLQQLELYELGWLDVQNEVDKVTQQYLDGTRTLEFTEQTLTRGAVQIKQMEVEAGLFNNNWQAAVALGQELGIKTQDALTMIETVGKELEILTSKEWSITVDVNFPGGFGISGGLGKTEAQPNALGGGVTAGRTVLVGERGPELFNPGVSGTITPNDQMGGSIAALESSMDGMRTDLRNGLLDLGQTIAEAMVG